MKDGKNLAIEIETGKPDAVYNIKKDLEVGFDRVIVIALSKKVMDGMLQMNLVSQQKATERLRICGPEEFG
jgi:hypothetical protein